MYNKIFRLLLIISVCVILTSCAKMFKRTPPRNNSSIVPNAIEMQLAKTAESIEKALETLAFSQKTNNPPVIDTAPLITAEGGMGNREDIDWIGPITPLIKDIAQRTNYRLKVLGNPPATPVIVSISKKNAIIADILKDAAFQAGKRANVVVFPASKVIELRYANL